MAVRKSIYAAWLKDCTKTSLPKVGGKNANLGEMINIGIRVPPGFAVTVDAYREVLSQSGIGDKIGLILSKVKPEETASIDKASENIRQLIRLISLPPEIAMTIDNYYKALAEECNVVAVPVSIRSSATAEDLPGASFAGQQET